MKSDVVEAQGLKMRLWDHEGTGPSVLFVHGYLDTGRSFDTLASELGSDVHAYALDLRGHGQSDRVGAGGSYHLLDHMKDLAIVLHKHPVDMLVAHSLGGNVALLVAGAMPSLVKRLVLIDTPGPPPEDPADAPMRLEELVRSVLEDKRAFSTVASVEDAARKVQAQNSALTIEGAMRMVRDVMVTRADGALEFPFDPRLRGPSPIRWPEPMWLALCQRLTMAVSIVRATNGYIPTGETFDARVAAMRATVHVIDGPHHLHVEQPAAIAAILRQQLFAA